MTHRFPISYEEMLQHAVPPPPLRAQYGDRAEQFGELWLPPGAGPFPVVLLVHGGCWRNTLPGLEFVRPLAAALQARGLAVWNVEYRRIGDDGGGYPGTFLDVAASADYLRSSGATIRSICDESSPWDIQPAVISRCGSPDDRDFRQPARCVARNRCGCGMYSASAVSAISRRCTSMRATSCAARARSRC